MQPRLAEPLLLFRNYKCNRTTGHNLKILDDTGHPATLSNNESDISIKRILSNGRFLVLPTCSSKGTHVIHTRQEPWPRGTSKTESLSLLNVGRRSEQGHVMSLSAEGTDWSGGKWFNNLDWQGVSRRRKQETWSIRSVGWFKKENKFGKALSKIVLDLLTNMSRILI